MKKIYFLFINLVTLTVFSQVTITPASFNVTDQITITVAFPPSSCNTMGTSPAVVYMHSGIGDSSNAFGYAVVGNWAQNDGIGQMTNNGNGTFSKTITPSTYYGISAGQQLSASKMGMVFRNGNGTQTLKLAPSCADFIFNVGTFQVTLNTPTENSTTIINSGNTASITATNTNGIANYNLYSNGGTTPINTQNSITSYNYTTAALTSNQSYDLQITQGASTVSKKFNVIVNPGVIAGTLPNGLEDGINYNTTDPTKATLVLDAPGKDFIYVAGSFNNYQPTSAYAMKQDSASGKFWLELTGLTSGTPYNYQYWVADQTPSTNSPVLVKTADPYSTLVLSPFDDPGIPVASYTPNQTYPVGQQREVTVLQTGQTPYNWQVTNFIKPSKDKLVVEEVLVRDFDASRNFQSLIDKVSYFKNLKINAIELMPVMEFEGNESWGYNTAFHMALDKFYGSPAKLKELIDIYHQNGIAVILDIALNHAFGRNPMVRMWMKDPDGDGWGDAASDNPYFNEFATHSYSVGNDFNHSQARTKYYVKRVIKQWIQEFHIDGFRWDLTKGFTQNCTAGDQTCTNAYQSDRVNTLKDYVDYSWAQDPTHYSIFEHLGQDTEEQQWANYRVSETPSKGVMMWGKMTDNYNQLTMGYNSNNDISRMGSTAHGFTKNRVIGFAESHDEERLMYKNLTYGNGSTVTTLASSLQRMSALGAVSLLVPGPKMIWHFGEKGWEQSIFTCNNGTVNTDSDSTPGDCKLDTKPQPQWTPTWTNDVNRNKIYTDWARIIDLKISNPVFSGNYSITSGGTLQPKIYVFDTTIPSGQLRNVVILSNFDVVSASVVPNFPSTGNWSNLMDNTTLNVTNTTNPILIEAGGFRIYGDQAALSNTNFEALNNLLLSPNPSSDYFTLNSNLAKVQLFSITGQLIKTFINPLENYQYSISELNSGLYLVKAIDENNNEKTMKLVKQ